MCVCVCQPPHYKIPKCQHSEHKMKLYDCVNASHSRHAAAADDDDHIYLKEHAHHEGGGPTYSVVNVRVAGWVDGEVWVEVTVVDG